MPLFLLHGVLAKRTGRLLSEVPGVTAYLCAVPDTASPDRSDRAILGSNTQIVDVGRKLLELLRCCQLEGRGLHRRQQFPVLRERAATAALTSGKCSKVLFSAISTNLSFRKFQLEIDVLTARVIQDHRSVIGGLLLFRPHSLDIGTALFQQFRRHLLCQLLLTARPEAVIFPEDETAGSIRTRKASSCPHRPADRSGAGADRFLLRGKQLFAILGNAGIGGHDLLDHRADTVHEGIRVSIALCDLRQFLFPLCCQYGRGQRLRQDRDKVDTGFCGDQALPFSAPQIRQSPAFR